MFLLLFLYFAVLTIFMFAVSVSLNSFFLFPAFSSSFEWFSLFLVFYTICCHFSLFILARSFFSNVPLTLTFSPTTPTPVLGPSSYNCVCQVPAHLSALGLFRQSLTTILPHYEDTLQANTRLHFMDYNL